MNMPARALAIASVLAIAACSQDDGDREVRGRVASPIIPAAPAHGGSVSAAFPMWADAEPADGAGPEVSVLGPYLSDLLERADFAIAFEALAGINALPAWTRDGGTAAPAKDMRADGRTLLVAHGCKPHDCATERLVLAYDEKSHAMWGVFARARRDRSDLDDGGADESRDELTWLGRPDAKIKAALKQWLYQSA